MLKFGVAIPFLALLAPVAVSRVPPLTDYPNHLARIWLLTGGINAPALAGMYEARWDTLTNIGTDVLAVLLSPLLGYESIGRVLVCIAVVLAPLGGVLLWRRLHRRSHWWQVAFALLAWNSGLLGGFLNFQMGLGLALLAAAVDPALSEKGLAVAFGGRAVLGAVLLLAHPFGLIFYGALLCGMAIGPDFRVAFRRSDAWSVGASILAAGMALVVPVAAFALLTRSLPGTQVGASVLTEWTEFRDNLARLLAAPRGKFDGAFFGIWTYAKWLDLPALACLGLPVLLSLLLGRLRVHAGMAVVCGGLLACYVVFPRGLAGAYWIDARFACMLGFAATASLCPDLPRLPARACAASLLLCSLLRTSAVAWIWHDRQADVASVGRALEGVPPGAAVVPLQHVIADASEAPLGRMTSMRLPSYWHLPALALPWRQAFVPTLFSSRGMQPIIVLPPWSDIAVPEGGLLPSVHALAEPGIYATSTPRIRYLPFWQTRFQYALVLNADMLDARGPFIPPPELQLVADEGFARLYRIRSAP